MVRELNKCEYFFKSKDLEFKFGVCKETKLPLLIKTAMPACSASFACFFSDPSTKDLSVVRKVYKTFESKVLTVWEDLPKTSDADGIRLRAMETVAHDFRYRATLEADAGRREELFTLAFKTYEYVLLSWCQTGITEVMRSKERFKSKPSLITPVPDMHKFGPIGLRMIAHCFAGAAVCALLGQRSPSLFFSLTSAAVAWNPEEVRVNCALI
jgi:hypothetical protein